ncbi:MAG: hypothetical protein HY567_03290 [Candidatus Kerfeldbacteria bacterium]|nr:hypothetical protein [Candidatus Kerfeldbacteria bacterium]
MPRFLTTTVLIAFSLSLMLSVWLLSSCSAHTLASLQPFAPYVNACSLSAGTEHVQLWKTLLLTFVLTTVVLGTIRLTATVVQGFVTYAIVPLATQSWPNTDKDRDWRLKRRDPLAVALASGILQHGSRNH